MIISTLKEDIEDKLKVYIYIYIYIHEIGRRKKKKEFFLPWIKIK